MTKLDFEAWMRQAILEATFDEVLENLSIMGMEDVDCRVEIGCDTSSPC